MPTLGYPVTSAIRKLRNDHIPFVPYLYAYSENGGTAVAAAALGFPEHEVIKTLVMQTGAQDPLIILMHGDREVSTRQLARALQVKSVSPVEPSIAQRLTGYVVGGISPFGVRTTLPIYMEESICLLNRVYINAGKRGFLVGVSPTAMRDALRAIEVSVGV